MTSNYSLAKPMSEGGSIAVGLLLDVWGATSEATVFLSIHDLSKNKMVWNFDHKLASTLGPPAGLVDALMRQANRKIFYFVSPALYDDY